MGRACTDTRQRILAAATDLFSEKGFEGARVNEIAQRAQVNKALIYHYFAGKQDILDDLVKGFFDEVMGIGIRFIHSSITRMIREGQLDIIEDRPYFPSAEAEAHYRRELHVYYENLLAYLMTHRKMLRIILAEALRNGSQHDALLRFFLLSEKDAGGPMFRALSELDPDVHYSEEVVFRKFFFALLPLLNYVAFADDYLAVAGLGREEMRQMFVRALEQMYFGDLVGQGVWIL